MIPLSDNQTYAINKFNKLKVGALFMQQGTGKTRVAIELANGTDAELVVFIVPHSLTTNVKLEANKWSLSKQLVIETYQGISQSDARYLQLLHTIEKQKTMIIADESIFIKNDNSKTAKRMLELSKKSEYRLILNGTPITKNEWDIYNQMEFLSPLIINMNRSEFLNTFFKRIKYKKRGEKEREFYKFSNVNAEYLSNLIEPYIFKSDLIFPHIEKTHRINIEGNVDDEYYEKKELFLNTLKYCDGPEIISILRNMEYLIFTDKDRLKNISKLIEGRCIVFCNFLKEIKELHSACGGYMICGDTKNRDEILEKFKHDDKPLFIMLGIGAYGHNLQFCNRVLFSSISFDFGKVEQAMYRIKRLGQERDIEYTYFTSDYGIYSMIENNLSHKKTLQELIKEKLENGEIKKCL